MRIALLGLLGSGKTTVFNAVADVPVAQAPGALQTETHVQVVKVRDPRLERMRDMFRPKKYTPAGLELWDPPGLAPGTEPVDAEKRAKLLAALREVDGYVVVLSAFATDAYAYPRALEFGEAGMQRAFGVPVRALSLVSGRGPRGLTRRSHVPTSRATNTRILASSKKLRTA